MHRSAVLQSHLPEPAACGRAVARRCAAGGPAGRTVGVGFIGAGDISNVHAAALRELSGAELRGLWSRAGCPIVPDPAAKAREYGCTLYPSAESLVAAADIDCVFVLTNYETHLQYARMAMEAGKPVLVEKPAAQGAAQIAELIGLSRRLRVPCMPVHNYVYEAGLLRTRQMIEQGRLGRVTALYVMYNIYHPEEVCARLPGIIRQIGTHHCYTAMYLLGGERPARVSAFRSTIRDDDKGTAPQENLAAVSLHMPSGAVVHLQMSFAADDHSSDPWSFYVKVVGTKGAARYSYNDWVHNARTPPGVHSHTYEPYPHTIAAADRHFIDGVVRGGAAPLSSLDDALACQHILDAAERSSTDGVHVRM